MNISDHIIFQRFPGHVSLRILLQVELTTLPGNTAQNGAAGSPQAFMAITDNQLHPIQTPFFESFQEIVPVPFTLAQGHCYPKYLPVALCVNSGSD